MANSEYVWLIGRASDAVDGIVETPLMHSDPLPTELAVAIAGGPLIGLRVLRAAAENQGKAEDHAVNAIDTVKSEHKRVYKAEIELAREVEAIKAEQEAALVAQAQARIAARKA